MRLLLAFITILAILPTLIRWTAEGKLSVAGAALLAIFLVFLLSIGSRAFKFIIPLVALIAFGLQYADQSTWQGILKPITALLPLGVALFGIYIMFRGAFGPRG